MKFALVRNILGLVTISGLALAKSQLCEELYHLEVPSTENCIDNENGEVVSIDYYLEENTSIEEKILSLKSLESLEISAQTGGEFNLAFNGFTKLKSLNLKNRVDEEDTSIVTFAKNGLKLPKNLKELKISGFIFNQDAIDEITSLSNLETLDTSFTEMDNVNLEKFANCQNLYSLEMFVGYDTVLPDNVLTNFKTIKSLTLYDVTLTDKNINDIASLTQLEKFSIQIEDEIINKLNIDPIKNLPNLKELEINHKKVNLPKSSKS